ncbi:hypothetical protein BDZ85DRAFT_266686 [Elsinoe ampelina]|uniref:SnoaL-like domain-containing protein n=1 Tax=Elsinoe ampelina TaxID=302913 RepID=A0A6A6G4F7_9PEZI|nr:hypothetical protein BDZ85DRAFT_266686 [Elsinoe ampelina]
MQLTIAFAGVATLLSIAAPALADASPSKAAAAFCPPRPASAREQRKIFNEFVNAFLVEKDYSVNFFNTYIAEDYIQHNPFALSGRQAVIDFFSTVSPDAVNNTVISKGIDGNFAYVHYRIDQLNATQPSAVADIYRFNGSCIQEHWDVIQQRPANAINPIALF